MKISKCEYLFTGKRILAIICAWHKILDIYAQCTLWHIVYIILYNTHYMCQNIVILATDIKNTL